MLALHLPECPANAAEEKAKALKATRWREIRLSKIGRQIQANA